MEVTLTKFVAALRSAELPVSPAETLDGYAVLQHIGIADPVLLENSLSLVLAKTVDEKARFRECFQRFFHQLAFREPASRSMLRDVDGARLVEAVRGAGDDALTGVVRAIVSGELDQVAWRVQQEAEHVQLSSMQTLRDKSRYARAIARRLGVEELEALITRTESMDDAHVTALRYLNRYIRDQVRAYVDAQYELQVDATGRRSSTAGAGRRHSAACSISGTRSEKTSPTTARCST